MARINVPDGKGLERIEIADDCPINQTADPSEDPSHYVHG